MAFLLILGLTIPLAAPRAASAYTGGPMLIDLLGWDATSHRVYFHTIPATEGYHFGSVYYFDLRGAKKEERVQVAWSAGAAEADDPDRNQKLESLRDRLTPLVPKPGACLGWGTEILDADTVQATPLDRRVLYRVVLTTDSLIRFEFAAYGRPDACVKDVYEIPDRQEQLYIVAFRGNPFDVAETQVAVLVSEPFERVIPVTWKRDK